MKKSTINILCGVGILLPLILLFWPMSYNMWSPMVSTLLRVIPAISAQVLFCGFRKNAWLQILPLVLTGFLAGWGTFLYFTSESWADATFMGLLADYVSPFIGCAIVLGIWHIKKKVNN